MAKAVAIGTQSFNWMKKIMTIMDNMLKIYKNCDKIYLLSYVFNN